LLILIAGNAHEVPADDCTGTFAHCVKGERTVRLDNGRCRLAVLRLKRNRAELKRFAVVKNLTGNPRKRPPLAAAGQRTQRRQDCRNEQQIR